MATGGRTYNDLSAKDFKGPLLAVLGDLSKLTPDEPIRHKDTWAPVCLAMGITLDEYGKSVDGKNWVQTWIGWAFRHLKGEGLGTSKGRGKWALTQAGIDTIKAQNYQAKKAKKAKKAPIVAVVTEAPEAVTELTPGVGVSLNIGGGNDDSGYHHDPYIRALAVAKTRCYGLYSARSKACGPCKLSGPCQNFVAAGMSALAATLATEDTLPKAGDETEAAGATPTVPDTRPNASSGWDNTGAESLVSHVAAVCYRCSDNIEPGSKAFWIPSETVTVSSSGLFHVKCWGDGPLPKDA